MIESDKLRTPFLDVTPDPHAYDEIDAIQGDVPDVQIVSHSLPVEGNQLLQTDEALEEFVANNPYIEEQKARGNVMSVARRASHAVVTVAKDRRVLGGAALAAGAATVVFLHNEHKRRASGT